MKVLLEGDWINHKAMELPEVQLRMLRGLARLFEGARMATTLTQEVPLSREDALLPEDVMAIFEACGALLRGHFILSSGLHSDTYLNKSIVSKFPNRVEPLCRAIAFKACTDFETGIDYVISPAMGGIIYGYETARALDVPFMYTERVDGVFELRRGFYVEEGAKILIVEDIISTGLSARECVSAVTAAGGDVLGVGCLIDRSAGRAEVGVPVLSLAKLDVPSYSADALPIDLQNIPAVKPGSRGLV